MIKVIKHSNEDTFLNDRDKSSPRIRHSSLSKYGGKSKPYDVINISLKSEGRYTPCFLAIKSNSLMKRL
jgi:hypothetical protein